jgi:alpha-D-xyloside xylohydrolase
MNTVTKCFCRLLMAAFAIVMFFSIGAEAAAIPVTSVTQDATGVTFGMTPGSMRIDVCTDGIIRVRYGLTNPVPVDPNMSFLVNKTWSTAAFTETETANDVTIVTSKLQVKVTKSTGAVTFLDAGGATVLQETAAGGKTMTATTINGQSTYRCEQIFDSPADEGIYGLGSMHDGFINFHGMPEYLHQDNTHISIPMIISSKGYGILWANASRTYFNLPDQQLSGATITTTTAGDYVFLLVDGTLGSGDVSITVNGTLLNRLSCTWHSNSLAGKITLPASTSVSVAHVGGGTLYGGPLHNTTKFTSRSGQTIDYYFFYGPTPDEAIAGYRLATGTASMFSKGTYGFIQCRERYSSQAEILDNAYQFRSRNIPVDVIVQDWNYWINGWGSMEFDPTAYPNPTQMIDSLHRMNYDYMISVWSNPQGGAVNTALVNQGLKITGTNFYDAYNPTARSVYWQYMNSNLFSRGVDAFWQDADEPEGTNLENYMVNFGSGQVGGKSYLNAYGMFVCKNVYEGWRATASTKRVCVLSRSSFAGNQRFGSMVWNGDIGGINGGWTIAQGWDWYNRSFTAGLNYCMAGMPYWTTDIGGFFRPSNQYTDAGYQELLTRWIEYGAFCPMFRIHGYQSQTEIWRYGATVQNNFLIYDKLRYRLLPYIYSMAGMVTNSGYTIMRGLVMDFRNDAAVLNIGNQFMFGPAFMVSPVTAAGLTSRPVYLPAGRWYDFWTGDTATGGGTGRSVLASAPLNRIPLYMRAGTIVPMGPELQYAAQKQADTIELRVYRGANGSFTLYEDQGDNYSYETGSYATIPMSYNDVTGKITIGARSGNFTGMLTNRVFTVVFVSSGHGVDEPKTAAPDCIVNYTGVGVTACPVAGVCSSCGGLRGLTPSPVTLKTVQDRIALSSDFSGRAKEIALYNCSGRLLQKIITRRQIVSIRKDMGMPAGMYIVKVRAIQ